MRDLVRAFVLFRGLYIREQPTDPRTHPRYSTVAVATDAIADCRLAIANWPVAEIQSKIEQSAFGNGNVATVLYDLQYTERILVAPGLENWHKSLGFSPFN